MSEFGSDNPPPPPEISFFVFVVREWEDFRPEVKKGKNVSHRVSLIDRRLASGRAALAAGKLVPGYNWERDLTLAEDHHALLRRGRDAVEASNSTGAQLWRDLAKKQSDLSAALMLGGVNLIFAGHGATAIAAMNALVSDRGEKFQAALGCLIIGGLIGLALVTCGKLIAIEWLSRVSSKLEAMLAYPNTARVRAAGKYLEKISKRPAKAAERLIYGSIIWFVIYIVLALVMVIHS